METFAMFDDGSAGTLLEEVIAKQLGFKGLPQNIVKKETTQPLAINTKLGLTHETEEPLTPNHFLMRCTNSTQTPHPPDEAICLRKQWRIADAKTEDSVLLDQHPS
ncbi:uncharacterized protein LOC127011742 [Drosophila biarmipes]|uniref:uncharacterized protein LOC127011742 n=1 Tax=Drosophila biarmipes TaxID=125945 RepID=UPI0021CC897B|nr:uncharacterized protein LOC127011742 [Drosophila biarmipes]